MPALAALRAAGKLPDAFRLAAVGREDWDDEAFRNWANAELERHANALPASAKRRVVSVSSYHRHFLAKTTVQNLLGTRLANRVLEPIWNSAHIARVDIVWDETLALEGRAGYYDGVGALKDMLQNHLLQLLCLIAMEPLFGRANRRPRRARLHGRRRCGREAPHRDLRGDDARARQLAVGRHALPDAYGQGPLEEYPAGSAW